MIYHLILYCLVVLLSVHVMAQTKVLNPQDGVYFSGCYRDLVVSDADNNKSINKQEFLKVINEYGHRRCYEQNELTLKQHSAFNNLACLCRSWPDADPNCCLVGNAKIPIDGAEQPDTMTAIQEQYLRQVCIVVDAAIDGYCPNMITAINMPALYAQSVNPDDSNFGVPIAIGAACGLLLFGVLAALAARRNREKHAAGDEDTFSDKFAEIPPNTTPDENVPPRPLSPRPCQSDDGSYYEELRKENAGTVDVPNNELTRAVSPELLLFASIGAGDAVIAASNSADSSSVSENCDLEITSSTSNEVGAPASARDGCQSPELLEISTLAAGDTPIAPSYSTDSSVTESIGTEDHPQSKESDLSEDNISSAEAKSLVAKWREAVGSSASKSS